MAVTFAIPPVFLKRMSRYLEEEYSDFERAMQAEPVNGLRVNTLKLSGDEFQKRSPVPLGEPVPWSSASFILPHSKARVGSHPYHQAGLYYIQDPSAMAPASLLDPHPGERVLDLAAAPGGKTTHLAALMQGTGLLVANDIKDSRVGHLVVNMERWGAGNVVITNETPERLADHFGPFFDRVLVDAPCSGEGMFRKDPGARAAWSPEMVAGCAVRQRNILRVAAKLVRPGGTLMYSTCTFAVEEDEAIIHEFLTMQSGGDGSGKFEVIGLSQIPGFMPGRPDWLGVNIERVNFTKDLCGAVRLFPHQIKGEGHFVCLLKKVGTGEQDRSAMEGMQRMNHLQEGLWRSFSEDVLSTELVEARMRVRGERLYLIPEALPDLGNLRVVHPGVWLGNFKKERFEPAHALAHYLMESVVKKAIHLSPADPFLEAYLRGETIQSPGAPGWVLVCVDEFGLGWGKRVQGILKNHYPRGWVQR